MTESIGKLAWSVLRACQSTGQEYSSAIAPNSRVVREAARLASLNVIWGVRHGAEPESVASSSGFRFSRLSHAATLDEVQQSEVEAIEKYVLDTLPETDGLARISGFSDSEFTELLGDTHSMGCFLLPEGKEDAGHKRSMGAYYTPRGVSDHIAERTMGLLLDALIQEVSRGSVRSLTRLMTLRTLDPACGPGTFLLSAAKQFTNRIERIREASAKGNLTRIADEKLNGYPENIARGLYGVDLDAAALEIADFSIRYELGLDLSDSHSLRDANLRRGNSLISLRGRTDKPSLESFFEDSSSRYAFEWSDEFSEILGRAGGGFDFILMNPPYERLKPNMAEFMRERLLMGSREIHDEEFEGYRKRLSEDVEYFRNSGEYKLGNTHTIDTYRLFIERALQLTREGGRIGFVVPSTLLGDLSAHKLRRSLLLNNRVETVEEFNEGSRLFPGVTQAVCIVVVERGGTTIKLRGSFNLDNLDEAEKSTGLTIDIQDIQETMGDSLVIPRVPGEGWSILEKLHRNPPLGQLSWLKNRRGELDLTMHKEYVRKGRGDAQLIRGSHITRYSIVETPETKCECVNVAAFSKKLGSSRRIAHLRKPRLACQQVSNRAQRWRLKFAPVPSEVVLANSCNYIVVREDLGSDVLPYLLGVLNSDLMNWRFEVSNTNNHVSNRELSSLPIVDITAM
ncbi:MAG: Eco57I restriction-modification methylase domain-containing protein, partial [Candidatus Thorarchaeota archaeon]